MRGASFETLDKSDQLNLTQSRSSDCTNDQVNLNQSDEFNLTRSDDSNWTNVKENTKENTNTNENQKIEFEQFWDLYCK